MCPAFATDDVAAYFGDVGVEWKRYTTLGNVGIVDDDVFVAAIDDDVATDTISRMSTIVFEEYLRSGLQLHLKPEKTAAMITWCGDGRASAKVDAYRQVARDGGVAFTVFGQLRIMPVCERYKHVGSATRSDGKFCSDITEMLVHEPAYACLERLCAG